MSPLDRLHWLELVAEKMRGNATAVYVALSLLNHRNHKTGRCNPSVPRLAHYTGHSESTVRRGIAMLETAELISVKRHMGKSGGRSSDYQFTLTPAKSDGGTPVKRNGGTPVKSDIKPPSNLNAGTQGINPGSATPPLEAGGEHKKDNPQSPEQIARNREKLAELRKTIGRPDNG